MYCPIKQKARSNHTSDQAPRTNAQGSRTRDLAPPEKEKGPHETKKESTIFFPAVFENCVDFAIHDFFCGSDGRGRGSTRVFCNVCELLFSVIEFPSVPFRTQAFSCLKPFHAVGGSCPIL